MEALLRLALCTNQTIDNYCQRSAQKPNSSTALTMALNALIAKGAHGVYTGGKGVMIRDLDDGLSFSDLTVVTAAFLVNDIVAPSTVMARPAPNQTLSASRSAQRALSTPRVNPGSRYRCGEST